MEGQAVTIGSSISQTGSMIVYCNKPYVLIVDDVVWTPIGEQEGGDLFVLTTSGFVEIMVDDVRVFFFRNVVTPSFTLLNSFVLFYDGETEVLRTPYSPNSYTQTQFPTAEIDSVVVRFNRNTSEPIEGLEITSNQGTAELGNPTSDWPRITITNVNPSEHLQVSLGNTLLAFALPYEN